MWCLAPQMRPPLINPGQGHLHSWDPLIPRSPPLNLFTPLARPPGSHVGGPACLSLPREPTLKALSEHPTSPFPPGVPRPPGADLFPPGLGQPRAWRLPPPAWPRGPPSCHMPTKFPPWSPLALGHGFIRDPPVHVHLGESQGPHLAFRLHPCLSAGRSRVPQALETCSPPASGSRVPHPIH